MQIGPKPALDRFKVQEHRAVSGGKATGWAIRCAGLGRLTTDAVVAYFGCALGAHARVRDPAWRWAAATGMLGLALVARRAYPRTDIVDLPPGDEVIDLISEPTAPHLDADERLAAPASTTR